jgi:hypothetical protein
MEFGSDILVDEVRPAAAEEYENNKESDAIPLVDELYSPFVQKSAGNTFAGSKYTNSVSDPQQKFVTDLDNLKNNLKLDKKQGNKKEEFPVELDKELELKLKSFKQNENLFSISTNKKPQQQQQLQNNTQQSSDLQLKENSSHISETISNNVIEEEEEEEEEEEDI